MEQMITMTQAAEIMGCKRQWVHYLITKKRLKAKKVGGIYILRERDVATCTVRARSKPGSKETKRPKAKKNSNKRVK